MNNRTFSKTRIERLQTQGYLVESDQKLADLVSGIWFAYRMCLLTIALAIVTKSMILFLAMICITLLGVVFPKHLFDYVYNTSIFSKKQK